MLVKLQPLGTRWDVGVRSGLGSADADLPHRERLAVRERPGREPPHPTAPCASGNRPLLLGTGQVCSPCVYGMLRRKLGAIDP